MYLGWNVHNFFFLLFFFASHNQFCCMSNLWGNSVHDLWNVFNFYKLGNMGTYTHKKKLETFVCIRHYTEKEVTKKKRKSKTSVDSFVSTCQFDKISQTTSIHWHIVARNLIRFFFHFHKISYNMWVLKTRTIPYHHLKKLFLLSKGRWFASIVWCLYVITRHESGINEYECMLLITNAVGTNKY